MNLYYSHLIHIVIVTTDATCRREEIVFFFGGGGGYSHVIYALLWVYATVKEYVFQDI